MSVMTLKELSDHPERASEEDLKALAESVRLIKEMGKSVEPLINGVTLESGRTKEEIAYGYYVDTMLMAAILESFTMVKEQEYKDISKFVFNCTDKVFFWDMPVTTYYSCLAKLCAIGLLKLTKEDKYNPTFVVTDEGLEAIRQQTYSNLAQAALFNLQTQRLNDKALDMSRRTVRQNWMMLIVAVASAIAAFVSVFFPLIN